MLYPILQRTALRTIKGQYTALRCLRKRPLIATIKPRLFSTTARNNADLSKHDKVVTRRNGSIGVVLVSSILCLYLGMSIPERPSTASTLPLTQAKKPQHDISTSNLQAAAKDVASVVGDENISTEENELLSHSNSSWSSYTKESLKPFLIVFPSSTEEVSAIMKICHRRKIPVTGYSGGTSVEGHYTPTRGGICIDFARMDKILEVHEKDLDVVVQPAVGWETLNEELAQSNLFFPPDPGPGARIGGMVATGCSGTNAYRYGTMKDWVMALTVVLADGTVIKTRQRPRKSSAGYDMTRLFVGSEGTLGLVTEAVLKVTPLPQSTSVAVASFPSIRAAADCVGAIVTNGVPIAAIEILDEKQIYCINKSQMTGRTWEELPTLFLKFAGTTAAVNEHIRLVQDITKRTGSHTFEFAKSKEEQVELWSARKAALWSVMALRRDDSDHVWTGDVAVPISRLPDIIEETKKELSESGLFATIVGHAGDGNFHATITYDDSKREVTEKIIHRMVKRAIEMEGTVTGEHGIGLVKRDYLPHELGQSTVDAMRQMKKAFDPLCLLNCDKIFRMVQPEKEDVVEW
ncbi:D-lactate dehydrogenase [Xylogone sp. PMI_703]|nr:D-lactate dehydrogenase [Xylogone sp. PMI_703]